MGGVTRGREEMSREGETKKMMKRYPYKKRVAATHKPGSKSNTGAGEIWSKKVKHADIIGGVFRRGFSKISRDP